MTGTAALPCLAAKACCFLVAGLYHYLVCCLTSHVHYSELLFVCLFVQVAKIIILSQGFFADFSTMLSKALWSRPLCL